MTELSNFHKYLINSNNNAWIYKAPLHRIQGTGTPQVKFIIQVEG